MSSTRLLAIRLASALSCVVLITGTAVAAEPTARPATSPASAADTATADVSAEPGDTTDVDLGPVTDEDALELDVVAVLNLPLAADQAREAGVDPDEVADVIGAVVDVGASPAVATEVLVAETDQARKRGGKPHFAGWVRGQLAEGRHSRQLVEMIQKREAQYIELSATERARLDAKLATMRRHMKAQREAHGLQLAELVKQGKKIRIASATELRQVRERLLESTRRAARIQQQLDDDPRKLAAFRKAMREAQRAMDDATRTFERARAQQLAERKHVRKRGNEPQEEDRR